MIACNFAFDTARLKAELRWKPMLSNHEMLLRSYLYFLKNSEEIQSRTAVSSHRKPPRWALLER
jgi:hypothetical protein